MGWQDFEKRHQQLVDLRRPQERRWRELARFLDTEDNSFDPKSTNEESSDPPFDSTGLYALDDYVGGLFVKANNPAERWFSFTLGPDNPLEHYRPVAEWLRYFENTVISSLDPSRDNFYLSTPAWFADMGTFGTGELWQEEGSDEIVARAISLREIYKDVDANGRTTEVHRAFMLRGLQAKLEYGNLAPRMRDDEQALFVQVVRRNDNFRPGALGPRGKTWQTITVSPDKRDFMAEGQGYYELPNAEIEWNKRSSRVWATGPGHAALADLRSNDEFTRSALVSAQREAEPMWAVQNEDIMTSADIVPDNIIYGGLSENGKRMVDMLERKNPPQLTLNERQEVRNAIRRAFRFSLAQVLANRPQMTAEEVMSYKAEDLKMLAPNLVRIHRGLGAAIARRANILMRQGRIPPPPPELENQSISPKFESPFAKAQEAETASSVLKWVNTKVSLQSATENPEWTDDIDIGGVSDVLHKAMTGVPQVRLDPRQVQQRQQQRAVAQAQQAQLEQASVTAEVDATNAHAAQARTRAQERQSTP